MRINASSSFKKNTHKISCIYLFLRDFKNKKAFRDFPGGPVVKTLPSNAEGAVSIPGSGTKILHAM